MIESEEVRGDDDEMGEREGRVEELGCYTHLEKTRACFFSFFSKKNNLTWGKGTRERRRERVCGRVCTVCVDMCACVRRVRSAKRDGTVGWI